VRQRELTQAEINLVHRTVARGTTPDQFALFLWHARKHHFDPVAKEVYCVLFGNSKHHQDFECPGPPSCNLPATATGIWHPGKDMVIMTGIGGLMGNAARNHADYGSVDEPEFTWFSPPKTTPAGKRIPETCTVRVWKKGAERPTAATLYWEEFAPVDLAADKAKFWNQMPKNQFAKCTRAQAIKAAYPDLTDIYIPEEMAKRMSMMTAEGREMTITMPAPAVGEVAEARKALRDAKTPDEARKAQEAFRQAQAGGKPTPTDAAATPRQPAAPLPGNSVLGVITVDAKNWTVTGDLANLSPELEKLVLIRWQNDQWHILPKDVFELEKVVRERNYRFQLLTPPPSSPPTGLHGPSPGEEKRRGGSREAVSSTVTGTIDRVSREIKGHKELGHITLAVGKKKPIYGSWDKDVTDILAAAIGKEATVELISRAGYSNIVGVVKVGERTYTDGKIPDVQQKDREPGKTLF
jgi:RecT family protein